MAERITRDELDAAAEAQRAFVARLPRQDPPRPIHAPVSVEVTQLGGRSLEKPDRGSTGAYGGEDEGEGGGGDFVYDIVTVTGAVNGVPSTLEVVVEEATDWVTI